EPGLSLLRLAQGKADAAAAGIRRALGEERHPALTRVRLLAAQADIASARADAETALTASNAIDQLVHDTDAIALRAIAARVRGAALLAAGDAEGALPHLRRAREGWQDVGAPYEVAEVRVLLGRAYRATGDDDGAVQELRAARTTFERLGAGPAAAAARGLLGEVAGGAEAPQRVRRAFLFSDIVKSTDLVGVIGDEAWEGLLAWHDQTLRSCFAHHRGEEVHHTGDGFFVAFDDARAAIACAVAIQQALAEHRRAHGFAPSVRMGVHSAEATRRGLDYSGGEVHKAARIAAAAGAEEILVSAETLEESGGAFTASDPHEIAAKGIAKPVKVARIDWRASGVS
ncbi:MAG: tetratricopeptide repeat protein, partial [Actinobacteria bacterium]|nr:tetratricopeptide repeat protein [Actinomycetota bacterium]